MSHIQFKIRVILEKSTAINGRIVGFAPDKTYEGWLVYNRYVGGHVVRARGDDGYVRILLPADVDILSPLELLAAEAA